MLSKSKIIYVIRSFCRKILHPFRTERFAISNIRNIFGVGFGNNDGHHLVDTLSFIKDVPHFDITQTPTYRFHNRFRPRTFFDISGIIGSEVLPVFVYPWGTFSDGSTRSTKNVRLSRFLGPSDQSLIRSEIAAIVSLRGAIKKHGFNPYRYPNSDINGTILVPADGSRRVCVVMQGNHRVSVMAHLGFPHVFIKPGVTCLDYVYEKELNSWPLVKEGIISADIALKIFRFIQNKEGSGDLY